MRQQEAPRRRAIGLAVAVEIDVEADGLAADAFGEALGFARVLRTASTTVSPDTSRNCSITGCADDKSLASWARVAER